MSLSRNPASFQNSKTENATKTISISEILKKTDEQIKAYLGHYVDKGLDASHLKNILEKQKKSATATIEHSIALVTKGTFGFSSSREEAIQKLNDWASGKMVETLKNVVTSLNESLSLLSLTSQKTRQNLEIDKMARIVEPIGKAYLETEETSRKITMALEHLAALLKAQNEKTNADLKTPSYSK